ncbi:Protein CBG06533 [Caenorhabditis briggsae]|uniref:Protein CBG06533 n=1 Tax=Caenorhabditis briggsae TaxID=6238 RepID=A8X2G5_CAEBR|nr:Protein CBG06533 [Caenorhabditis briggsae]CAP26825.1 Protein CBG06533 [Caenorhabditis briggsae]
MKISIFLLIFHFSENLTLNLTNFLEFYENAGECAFNYTQISSTTIEHFPKCSTIYGILVINEKTDLSIDQMIPYFENIGEWFGGLQLENTNFTSLGFFSKPKNGYVTVYCEKFGFYIRNNPNLTDYSILRSFFMHSNGDGKECDIQITNNSQLDAESFCDSGFFHYFTDLTVKGNLKDCGEKREDEDSCQGDEIDDSNLSTYKSCTKLYNGLQLKNMSKIGTSNLSKIQQIRGVIDIVDTDLEDLSFLKNLNIFKYRNQWLTEKVSFNLQNNLEMRRFGIPNFQTIHNTESIDQSKEEGIALFNFENLHPDFCLTIDEIVFFLKSGVAFRNLDSKVCATKDKFKGNDICRFESMEKLAENCYMILGDVTVDSGDEQYFSKLRATHYLFGSIRIRNTTLKSLEHLYRLLYIVDLEDGGPVIEINSNKKLRNVNFAGLQSIFTRDANRTAFIQDNHPKIFESYDEICSLVESTDMYRIYRTRLNFVGGNCATEMETMELSKSSWLMEDNFSTRADFVIFFLIFCSWLMFE